MQFTLFDSQQPQVLIDTDGTTVYHPGIFSRVEGFYEKLNHEVSWESKNITLYGRKHNIPRLQAFQGETDLQYTYSGITNFSQAWTPTVLLIKKQIESISGHSFNCVLCNLYRDGKDYVALHADNEKELGINPTIVSVSFGEQRILEFKHNTDKAIEKVRIKQEDGSALIMSGAMQTNWQHTILKSSKPLLPRISLTFRKLS